jgi:L-alanine-DL-glutamate epimerase-like enolase superfamily enzyme
MKITNDYFCNNKVSRRTALKFTLATAIPSYLRAAESNSAAITDLNVICVRNKQDQRREDKFLELATNMDVSGYGGPLLDHQTRNIEKLLPQIRKLLISSESLHQMTDFEWIWNQLYPDNPLSAYAKGLDPFTGQSHWNTRRNARHTLTGSIVTALSAVDNALWDLRGKLTNQPVYRLLGGKREKLRSYLSMSPGDDLAATRIRAKELFDMGHTAQKWFFRYGPPDGEAGFAKIVGLVEGLRSELGQKAQLMFDFAVGDRGRKDWDVGYAVRVAKAIQPFKPTWLEEPFSPEEIDCYRRLKGETDIPLATGEHTYSRWNIKPFLDGKLVSYVQSDPEWCGGISELLQVCKLVNKYKNVRVIPHGHHILAAAQTVASQPESLCPMVEFGKSWVLPRQRCQKRLVEPEAGYLSTPNEPGLGPSIDWSRCERL